jgi:beta-galactosidase
MLAAGASVNFYMFHGGTNFGLTNGANDRGIYRPIVTSYDYDAPLDEAGNPTAKYRAFRDVIAQFSPVPEEFPPSAVAAPAWETRFTAASALAGLVPDGQWYEHLPTHDVLGVPNGFVLYRTEVELDRPAILQFAQVRDRAIVSFEGRPLGVISRDAGESALLVPAGHGSLELLVEDLGRVNYGPRIGEPKGLIGPVSLGGEAIQRWRVAPLDLDALVAAPGTPLGDVAAVAGPVILHAELELKDPTDLFLDTRGWGKGVVWINGFCLGRYWSRPPQRTLYVPAPVLRRGTNRVCVFELHVASPVLRFAAWPDLGQVED